jgi:hypothetical protein
MSWKVDEPEKGDHLGPTYDDVEVIFVNSGKHQRHE